jgi:hypothetical protein
MRESSRSRRARGGRTYPLGDAAGVRGAPALGAGLAGDDGVLELQELVDRRHVRRGLAVAAAGQAELRRVQVVAGPFRAAGLVALVRRVVPAVHRVPCTTGRDAAVAARRGGAVAAAELLAAHLRDLRHHRALPAGGGVAQLPLEPRVVNAVPEPAGSEHVAVSYKADSRGQRYHFVED